MALLAHNGCFMGVDEEGDVVCTSKKAGPAEFCQVRNAQYCINCNSCSCMW